MTLRERSEIAARFATIPEREERLVLATGRYIGEGFDDARLDTMFLAMPAAWKGTLAQYTGRLHRLHPGKTELRIYDCVDRDGPVLLRMFEKRRRAYRAIGYGRDVFTRSEGEALAERRIGHASATGGQTTWRSVALLVDHYGPGVQPRSFGHPDGHPSVFRGPSCEAA